MGKKKYSDMDIQRKYKKKNEKKVFNNMFGNANNRIKVIRHS